MIAIRTAFSPDGEGINTDINCEGEDSQIISMELDSLLSAVFDFISEKTEIPPSEVAKLIVNQYCEYPLPEGDDQTEDSYYGNTEGNNDDT